MEKRIPAARVRDAAAASKEQIDKAIEDAANAASMGMLSPAAAAEQVLRQFGSVMKVGPLTERIKARAEELQAERKMQTEKTESEKQAAQADKDKVTEEQIAAQEAARVEQARLDEEARLAREAETAEQRKAAEAAEAEQRETEVAVSVPRSFNLNLPGGQVVAVRAGTTRLNRAHAEHGYAKAQGVRIL